MMTDDDLRQMLLDKAQLRKQKRQSVRNDLAQAKHDLHPKTLATNWLDAKKATARSVAQTGKQNLEKNAPVLGAAGLAVLLFAARKPIFKLWTNIRNRASATKEQQQ